MDKAGLYTPMSGLENLRILKSGKRYAHMRDPARIASMPEASRKKITELWKKVDELIEKAR